MTTQLSGLDDLATLHRRDGDQPGSEEGNRQGLREPPSLSRSSGPGAGNLEGVVALGIVCDTDEGEVHLTRRTAAAGRAGVSHGTFTKKGLAGPAPEASRDANRVRVVGVSRFPHGT